MLKAYELKNKKLVKISRNKNALRRFRLLNSFTLTEVAKELKINPSYLTLLETGKRKSPSIAVAKKLCNFYSTTFEILFG